MCIANEIFDNISNTIYGIVQDDATQFNIEEYLECRECSDFDENWVISDKVIENHKAQGIINEFSEIESQLRERVFKQVLSLTDNYDLASYISDDAGLIYSNVLFKCNDFFTNKIYDSYKSNKLPL